MARWRERELREFACLGTLTGDVPTMLWVVRFSFIVFGVLGALLLLSSEAEARLVGLAIMVICATGTVFNWGPLIPCTFFGILLFVMFSDSMARTYEEAAYKTYGVPAMGAFIGALVGYAIDARAPQPAFLRQFSLRTLLIAITLVAVVLGVSVWASR